MWQRELHAFPSRLPISQNKLIVFSCLKNIQERSSVFISFGSLQVNHIKCPRRWHKCLASLIIRNANCPKMMRHFSPLDIKCFKILDVAPRLQSIQALTLFQQSPHVQVLRKFNVSRFTLVQVQIDDVQLSGSGVDVFHLENAILSSKLFTSSPLSSILASEYSVRIGSPTFISWPTPSEYWPSFYNCKASLFSV